MQILIPEFLSVNNPSGAEPVPDAALIWNSQNGTEAVTPGSTVRFHIVNIGAFAFFHVWIEEHNMTVIEVDGVDVEPYETSGIDLAVGQRLSVLVTMDADKSQNYPIVGAMGSHFESQLMADQSMFDSPSAEPNVTAWLVYNKCAPNPSAQLIQSFYEFNDTDLVPLVPLPVVPSDVFIPIVVNFTDIDGINMAIINNNTYVGPNVPAIYTALTTGTDADNPALYGNTTNSFVLNHLDMVYLAINNDDTGGHPCTFSHKR
jgi:iron transport multicopper oxidase